MGVEVIRIAKQRFENEEKMREIRYRQQLAEGQAEDGDTSAEEYGV